MIVMSVQGSLENSVAVLLQSFRYDVMVVFTRPHHAAQLGEATASVPGVTQVEVWDRRTVYLLLSPKCQIEVGVYGVPTDSQMFSPQVVSGRGLMSGDEQLTQVTGNRSQGSIVMLSSEGHDAATQNKLIDALSEGYAARGIETMAFQSAHQFREISQAMFSAITGLLLTMVLLAAIMGSVGLTGALAINIFERKREIGIMCAIGTTPSGIIRAFAGEGMIVGVLSWLFAVPISHPAARAFSDMLGTALFGTSLDFSYSRAGVLLWLVIVLALSALASLWPALAASRVSVREALVYE